MKKIFIFIIGVLAIKSSEAQQWLEFSQQDQYKLFLNPALAGSESTLYATLAHRSQYTFLSSRALASQFLEFSSPIRSKKYGLGFRVANDFIGYQRYTLVELTGAYHLQLKRHTISFGLAAGLGNLNLNGSKLRAAGGNYENQLVIHNDEILPLGNTGSLAPSLSVGIHYKINNLKLGIGAQNLNSPTFKLLDTDIETNIAINRTINTYLSYVIELDKVNFKPMLSFSTDFVKNQVLFGVLSEINNISFALAFRGYSGLNNDAIIGSFGLKLKNKIKITYSYDYNVSFLNQSNFGSHEFSLSYFIPKKFSTKNKGNVLYHPRFL